MAREFVVALPIELSREEQIELLQEFIREQFVSDGMCADAAIHDTDGHNPHAHILLTVRPLDEQGKWQYKTEKEYLCMRNGEERGFTAAEFRTAQNEGWEKQYPYKVGKKKVYMVPSEADAQGLVRADKHPKSTRYGRQNPISERWNSEEQLAAWRAAWADVSNRYLERAGREERIDHRSNAARGLDEIPTIHEGVAAQALERKGIISDRCELNRQIKADNALLRELKAEIKKLAAMIARTVPDHCGGTGEAAQPCADFLLSALSYSQRQIAYSEISRRMEAGAGALYRAGAADQGKKQGAQSADCREKRIANISCEAPQGAGCPH